MKDFQSNLPWFSSKKKLLEENPNHHAYIFEGLKGLGKKIFTLEIAKGLLCSSLPNGTFCNQCPSCPPIYYCPELGLTRSTVKDKINLPRLTVANALGL